MKKTTRTILFSILATIVIGYALVAVVWLSHSPQDALCRHLYITIADSTERQYINEQEIRNYLLRTGLDVADRPMHDIACHEIEKSLLQHDLIRTAECYKSPRHNLYVRVTQRVPAMYVVANDGCYYVDTDRKIMPLRASVKADVPTFSGAVSRRAATEEYFDFAQWLSRDTYWKPRIESVVVYSPKNIVLTQKDMSAHILLGSLDGYKDKMQKLNTLYTKGFDQIGYKPYREYDLRFNGQVVGRY